MNADKDYKLVKIYCYVCEKYGDSLHIVFPNRADCPDSRAPFQKLCVGIGIGISVLEAEYSAFGLAQHIVEHSLHTVPI